MKTDAELNRLIAERVMGWTTGKHDRLGNIWDMPNGMQTTCPAYCTDPAAWGGLFVWLAEQGRQPELFGYTKAEKGDDRYCAILYAKYNPVNARVWPTADGSAASPGRALVLATLAAYGVEVGE